MSTSIGLSKPQVASATYTETTNCWCGSKTKKFLEELKRGKKKKKKAQILMMGILRVQRCLSVLRVRKRGEPSHLVQWIQKIFSTEVKKVSISFLLLAKTLRRFQIRPGKLGSVRVQDVANWLIKWNRPPHDLDSKKDDALIAALGNPTEFSKFQPVQNLAWLESVCAFDVPWGTQPANVGNWPYCSPSTETLYELRNDSWDFNKDTEALLLLT